MLLKARRSVETTSPLARQEERLKEAAMLFWKRRQPVEMYSKTTARIIGRLLVERTGPTKMVAHFPGAFGWHGESTQEFTSVSHL